MYATDLLDEIPAYARAPWTGEPLIVDSFAGGGGASTGIEMALGRSPDIAINHNPAALALHAANHPETLHISENVYKVDPLDYLRGRHVGLAWFSPDCKHFSKAKGGKPVERNIRDLAWIIPGWIERIQKSGGRVDVVIMENVEEFSGWGPLIETDKGLMPCPERKGHTFEQWCKRLKRLGGRIEKRELRACDYGAPTIRKRLFVIIRFDRLPIVWPAPTHGAPDDPDVLAGRKLPWRMAAEIIDWSIPCPSIFDSGAEIWEKHGLRAVRPLAGNTMARIARGMKRYVLDAEEPFLVNLTHGARCEGLGEPLNTVTGAHRGEKAVVSPHLATMRNAQKPYSGLDEPTHTITAGGAGLTLIAPQLSAFYGPGNGGQDRSAALDEPLRTVTTENRHAVVAPVLSYAQQGGGNRAVDEPVHTICASDKDQNQVIAPVLVQTGYGERPGQEARSLDPGKPLGTIVAGGIKHAAGAVFLAQHNGDPRPDGGDAARPGRSAAEPLATITASGTQSQAVAAFLAQNNYMEPGHDVREPLSTIVGKGSTQSVVQPFISRQFGTSTGHAMDAPLGTITADGQGKSALIAPHLTKMYGKSDGQPLDDPAHTIGSRAKSGLIAPHLHAYYGVDQDTPENEPIHTLTTKPRFSHVETLLDAPPFTPAMEARAREVADFMRGHGFWDERPFVTLAIGAATFVVVDIGMRMLTPRELYNAQGFPPDYEIERGPEGQVFSKSVQVSCVGNSVSPPVAAALAGANCGQLAEWREAAE